jgi:hypothetical protein
MKTRIITISAAAALMVLALAGCTAAAPAATHTVIQQKTPATTSLTPTPTITVTPTVTTTERETQAPSRPPASPDVKQVIHRLLTFTTHVGSSVAFWTAIATLVALLLCAVQISRWRRPRRLIYAQKKPGPQWWSFLSPAVKARAMGSAMLSFDDLASSEPNTRIIEIILAGDGRQDIPSDLFDLKEPVTVDAGTPIFAVLSNSRPKWIRAPSARIDGQYLRIGPGLIARRQYLSYQLLVSDAKSDVTLQAALTDVTISINNGYGLVQRRLRAMLVNYPFSLITVGACLVLMALPETRPLAVVWQYGLQAVCLTFILAFILGCATVGREGVMAALIVPDGGNIKSDEEGPPAGVRGTIGSRTRTNSSRKLSTDAEGAASGAEERAEAGGTVGVMPADVWRSGEKQGDDHADSYHEA